MEKEKFQKKLEALLNTGELSNIQLAYSLGQGLEIEIEEWVKVNYGTLLELLNQHCPNKNKTIQEQVVLLLGEQELNLQINTFEMLPPAIGKLQQLVALNLSYGQLKELPKEIGNLKNLEVLDLMYNQLTTLPSSIGQLGQLEILFLADNKLTALPKEIGNLKKLKKLVLANNEQLSTLPKEIYQLKNLFWISLSGTAVSECQVKELKKALPHLGISYKDDLPF